MLEYVGITIVVAGVIVALAMTTVPSDIQAGFANGVCRIVNPGDPDCKKQQVDPDEGANGDPTGGPTGGDPSTNPTGDPTTGPTGDPGDPNQDPASKEYDDAKKAADKAAKAEADAEKEWGNLDKELLDLVAELVGWNSAKDCFTKGDIGACLETLLTAIPWGKLFKAAKMIPKIWKLFRRWQKLRDKLTKARKAKKKADDRLQDAKDACTRKKKPGNSFTPGTRVLLADGRSKPIEAIRTGDRVLATDPVTGLTRARDVTDLIVGYGTKRLVDVSVDLDGLPGGSTAKVTATANHPFWVSDAGLWINAGDLVRGDQLRTEHGEARTVTALRERTEVRRVHNLTVAGLHTYYVQTGGQWVLVHNDNKNPCETDGPDANGGFKVGVSGDEIEAINKKYGGATLRGDGGGSPENMMMNANRYNSFWEKSAVVIRDIAGNHMYDNGNKRTAQEVVELLMQRNSVTSGPTSDELRSVITKVGKGELKDVGEIASALRGF